VHYYHTVFCQPILDRFIKERRLAVYNRDKPKFENVIKKMTEVQGEIFTDFSKKACEILKIDFKSWNATKDADTRFNGGKLG
jgi:hypothetical protein